VRALGIETSCDETAVAVLDGDGGVRCCLVSSQVAAHAPYLGVVPELAARHHLEALPRLLAEAGPLLKPGGLFYSTITFDGATILQPEIDLELDARIEALYHQTMDERITADQPSGDSRSGRHLFGHLRDAGVELLDAGGSDWVVFAGPGGYPADEAYFLHFIVHTIQTALQGHPRLDAARYAARFADWIEQRHQQIERGELVYIAHQLDFLGRLPETMMAQAVPTR
jgi:hypothetical protein